jgi:hypothetical protein
MATTTGPAEIYVYSGSKWVSISPHGGGSGGTPGPHTHPVTDITGLSTVATTGDYNDLSNLPTIPPAQVNADWNSVGGFSLILNKPTLSAVATSGKYTDLTDEPTKLSEFVNDLGLVDKAGAAAAAPVQSVVAGSNVSVTGPVNGVYTIASTAAGKGTVTEVKGTAPIQVANPTTTPTISVSAATNSAAGVVTLASASDISAGTAGKVVDAAQLKAVQSGIPTVYQADWAQSSGPSSILNKPTLSKVATTGSYNDLSSTPTIPTKVSQLTNDVPYCELDTNGKVPASRIPGSVDAIHEAPSKANFPATGAAGTLYLDTSTGIAYRWSGTTYAEIVASPGTTDSVTEGSVNLYYTKARVQADAPVSSVAGRTGAIVLAATDISGLATVATSGSYSDLTNKPAVPAASTKAPSADSAAGVVGTSTAYARADHSHPFPTPADIGAATAAHTHDITTLTNYKAPPSPSSVAGSNLAATAAVGVSTDYARADHAHPLPTLTQLGAAAATHKHAAADVTGLATVATTGSYNDLSDQPTAYTLPIATDKVLGGVKIGSGITHDPATGVISVHATLLPNASTTTAGIIQVADAAAIGAGTANRAVDAAALKGILDNMPATFVEAAGDTMTGALTMPVGTAASPSLTYSNDSDTGTFSPSANTWAVATGGAERLRVDANGVVSAGGAPTTVAGNAALASQKSLSVRAMTRLLYGAGGASHTPGSRECAVHTNVVAASINAQYTGIVAIRFPKLGGTGAHGTRMIVHGSSMGGGNLHEWSVSYFFSQSGSYSGGSNSVFTDGVPPFSKIRTMAPDVDDGFLYVFLGDWSTVWHIADLTLDLRTTSLYRAVDLANITILLLPDDTGYTVQSAQKDVTITNLYPAVGAATMQGVVHAPLSAAPSGATAGQVYFDSTLKKLRVYDGTAWIDLH